jgi:protein-disulfide isomerase
VLGPEKEIIINYVEDGRVRIVFWPILDHGNASINAHAAADCVGRQSADAFWLVHDKFFADQSLLWSADRAYFVNAAVDAGVDQAEFEACYDSGTGHATVTELDNIRRGLGIFNRPTFLINDQLLVGLQPFEVLAQYIDALLSG